ncbi:DUF2996 domain-containing protein [Candidatus Synechococcus calcipolaris G9]|uniref:DUF2996 domain-containing protein n=1 Tax=Candidatus Synechococcus calcipolaris G9 TaxID=1497997 RepID=A0ABT6EVH1_9SYNE|nr:DUF2996 domain-containing protein [Candidatus Synechococcus calcipolaris]MDG2989801.1 DUF2996 domain-containing protein [Candidatus Synechococcus calcipolaris G9]
MSQETETTTTEAAQPKKTAKKEKPPALEDKPFGEFMNQDYLPALKAAFTAAKIDDFQATLEGNILSGEWGEGQRQFKLYFLDGTLQGRKAFVETTNGIPPSTIEPFLCDERKITLPLLVFGVMQRLNAQKWLGGN